MTAVWKLDLPPSDKMVLLALADAANDEGVTWMAVKSRVAGKADLLARCSLSERAVQGAIKRLCEARLLSRLDRPGKGVIWTVTPAGNAPPQEMRPAGNDADPRSKCGETVSKPQPSSEPKGSSEVASAREKAFSVWWEEYPSKVGKLKVRPAFDEAWKRLKAEGREPLTALRDGLTKAKASARWHDPTYTYPNPLTWLNRGGWDDDYGPPAPPRPGFSPVVADPALRALHETLLNGTSANA